MTNDYFVRLSFASLQQIRLVHLISGLDEDVPTAAAGFDVATAITGYTEWVNTVNPAITIGWDWHLVTDSGTPALQRVGEPRSNLMLVDAAQVDLGADKTATLLETLVDGMHWRDLVLSYIEQRYKSRAPSTQS